MANEWFIVVESDGEMEPLPRLDAEVVVRSLSDRFGDLRVSYLERSERVRVSLTMDRGNLQAVLTLASGAIFIEGHSGAVVVARAVAQKVREMLVLTEARVVLMHASGDELDIDA